MRVCVCVRVCLEDEIHFERKEKCHQMEYKHIFTTQSVGHHFGHFVREQCDDDTRVLSFKRNDDEDDDNQTTVIRKYLVTFYLLPPPKSFDTFVKFSVILNAQRFYSNGFYLHQMKDLKIDFTIQWQGWYKRWYVHL